MFFSFIVSPSTDKYISDFYKEDSDRDPKLIIRNAFARSGRVVQFMVASEDEEANNEQKVLHAVHEVYRQLGIVMLLDLEKVKKHKLKIPITANCRNRYF